MLRCKSAVWILVSALILTGAARSHAQTNTLEVTSPDHQISLRFAVQPATNAAAGADGQLVYSVEFHGKTRL